MIIEQVKELLRPCKIEMTRLLTYNVLAGGYKILKNVSSAESYNGIFHRWVNGSSNENFPETKVCGLVEYEDGTAHLIPMEYITFTDRKFENDRL